MKKVFVLLLLVLSLSIVTACKDASSDTAGTGTPTIPTPPATIVPDFTILITSDVIRKAVLFDPSAVVSTKTIKLDYTGTADYIFTNYKSTGTAFTATADEGCTISGSTLTVKPNGCILTVKFTPVAKSNSVASIQFGSNIISLGGSGIGAPILKVILPSTTALTPNFNLATRPIITLTKSSSPAKVTISSANKQLAMKVASTTSRDGTKLTADTCFITQPIVPVTNPDSSQTYTTTDTLPTGQSCRFVLDIDNQNQADGEGIMRIENGVTIEEYFWSYNSFKTIGHVADSNKVITPTHHEFTDNVTFADSKVSEKSTEPFAILYEIVTHGSNELYSSENSIKFSKDFFVNFKINKEWTTCKGIDETKTETDIKFIVSADCFLVFDFIPTKQGALDLKSGVTEYNKVTWLKNDTDNNKTTGDTVERTQIFNFIGKGI